MLDLIPDRRTHVRRYGCACNRLDLGCFSLRDLLASTRGLGNQPHRISAERGLVAHSAHGGRTTPPPYVDFVRIALGRNCADQYRSREYDAILLALAAVSITTPSPTIGWSCFVCAYRGPSGQSLAGAQLQRIRQVHLRAGQPSTGNV